MIIHHFPTVLVLSVVLMAGFAAGGFVGMIVEFFTTKIPFPVKELPLMFGLLGLPI